MSEPFIGQIKAFGFNFAPQGWAQCNGQLLAVSSNDALFSLLGTIYGGDGRSTFGLPDLRGRAAINFGQGPGLPNQTIGQKSGQETVTLITQQLPAHRHSASGNSGEASSNSPAGHVPAPTTAPIYGNPPDAAMNASMIGQTGGGQFHSNMEPYLVINWCIALFGIYPSRN